MKSITIHGLDDELELKIEEEAKTAGTSLNKTIKGLLKKALGLTSTKKDRKQEFRDLFGIWSKSEAQEFQSKIRNLDKIDREDWK